MSQGVHVTWLRSCDMNNTYPGEHLETSQSQLPLGGSEWDTSRLDKLRLSGFVKAYSVAADSMMPRHCQIKRATILLSVLFTTRFIYLILKGYVWLDRANEFGRQTRPSLATMQLHGIPSQSHGRAEQLGHIPARENNLGLRTVGLRDYDVGCWYEAWSITAHWVVRNGNYTVWLPLAWMHTCHLIYIGIALVGRRLNVRHNGTIVLLEKRVYQTKYRYMFRLLNHSSTRCPSWSYDLIYDIVWVWPDYYQECNAVIPHQHEHDN